MPPMKSPSKLIGDSALENSHSLTHLAHRWGVSRRDVRQLLEQGKLPFIQFMGQLRVPEYAVRRFEKVDT